LLGVLPRLGANGHVAFNSFYTPGSGPGGSIDFGYWVGAPGSLQLAVGENPGDSFPGNTNVGVDENGLISIWLRLAAQPAVTNEVLSTYVPGGNGGSTLAAQKGQTSAPGFAGGLFSALASGHASNDDGAVAFTGSVAGGDATGTSDFGLFTGVPGDLKLVAREGTTAPGASGTATVFSTTTTTIFDKRINSAGQVGFAAALSGPGIDGGNDRAIYVWTPDGGSGTLALAAQTGSTAPGTGSPTIRFSVMDDSPGFNDAGQVAFRSSLVGEGAEVTPSNNYGIWAGAPGSVELIARSGSPSPLAGVNFATPEPNPRINSSGQVVFLTTVTGSAVTAANNRILWLTSPAGDAEVLARRGTQAPGTSGGVNFNQFEVVPAVINAAGQVAFTATLVLGGSVTNANDRGLWAGSPGNLSLVAREGDMIDVDPGAGEVLKTISSFSFANGYIFNTPTESASAAFNDAGQIAWQAQFTDATRAILLTTLPALPGDDLDGDYNDDGIVDVADFVAWSKFQTTSIDLPNDDDPLPIDGDQYNTWRTHFGESDSGAAGLASVPEPSAMCIALSAVLAAVFLKVRQR
jgi:hypothetical protein